MFPRVALLVALALPVASVAAPQSKPPEVVTRGPAVPRPGLEALKRAQIAAARGALAPAPGASVAAPKEPPITTARPLTDAERAAWAAARATRPLPVASPRRSAPAPRTALAPRAWAPPKRTAPDIVTTGPADRAPLDAARRAKLARARTPAVAPAPGK